jgi:hypothetical protein
MQRFLLGPVIGAAVLLGGALGVAHAQTTPAPVQDSAKQHRQAILADAATQLGISADQLQQALAQAREDVRGRARPLADVRRDELQVAAQTLGLAGLRALRAELAGSTLNAVAQKHNVASTAVSGAIMADISARLQAAVAAGRLKSERVPELTQRAQTRVNALMTHQFPARKAS